MPSFQYNVSPNAEGIAVLNYPSLKSLPGGSLKSIPGGPLHSISGDSAQPDSSAEHNVADDRDPAVTDPTPDIEHHTQQRDDELSILGAHTQSPEPEPSSSGLQVISREGGAEERFESLSIRTAHQRPRVMPYARAGSQAVVEHDNHEPVHPFSSPPRKIKARLMDFLTVFYTLRTTQFLDRPPNRPRGVEFDSHDLFINISTEAEEIHKQQSRPDLALALQCMKMWIWNSTTRRWQPIRYGDARQIGTYEVALSIRPRELVPIWITVTSMNRKQKADA